VEKREHGIIIVIVLVCIGSVGVVVLVYCNGWSVKIIIGSGSADCCAFVLIIDSMLVLACVGATVCIGTSFCTRFSIGDFYLEGLLV